MDKYIQAIVCVMAAIGGLYGAAALTWLISVENQLRAIRARLDALEGKEEDDE